MSTIVPFPYPPDEGAGTVVDTLKSSTEILTKRSRKEQRIGLRGFPGGAIEYPVSMLEAVELASVSNLLLGHHADQWVVPLWKYAVLTAVDLMGGETFIQCTPPVAGHGLEIIPWQITPAQANPYLMLWSSPSNYQVLQFTGLATLYGWGQVWGQHWGESLPDAPTGAKVLVGVEGSGSGWGMSWGMSWGVAAGGGVAFPAGSLLIPARLARLDASIDGSLEALEAAGGRLRWSIEDLAD